MSRGIHRRLDGQTSNLSGKPTFLSVLLNDGWVAANDPKWTSALKRNNQFFHQIAVKVVGTKKSCHLGITCPSLKEAIIVILSLLF